jgi:hypothetical protein
MWSCTKCRVKVDRSFEVCWSCGTSSGGEEDPAFVRADDVIQITDPPEKSDPRGVDDLALELAAPPTEVVECYWAGDCFEAKFLADQPEQDGIPGGGRLLRPADRLRLVRSLVDVRPRAGGTLLPPWGLGPGRGPAPSPALAGRLRRTTPGQAEKPLSLTFLRGFHRQTVVKALRADPDGDGVRGESSSIHSRISAVVCLSARACLP